MKDKILIVSSEQLSPSYTLGSIFELAQAKILQKNYVVSIISVQNYDPLIPHLKSLLKSLAFLRLKRCSDEAKAVGFRLRKMLQGRKYWCEKNIIEGVEVYSGYGFDVRDARTDQDFYNLWLGIADAAYLSYESDHGEPVLIHAHGRFLLAGLFALRMKKWKQIRYVYTEHSSRFPSGFVPASTIPLLNEIIDNCTIYIAVSKHLLDKVNETLDRDIVNPRVIFNVLDPVYQQPLDKKLSKNVFRFINIANLEHRKGLDILLRAFKRAFHGHPSYRLDIVGDGPVHRDLVNLCHYLEIEHVVEFLGEKTKAEIVGLLDRSNVFVFPSRFETFGVAVIEALSRGCPVIATACGGPEEFIPESCGVVIETENENELVWALNRLVSDFRSYDREKIREYAMQEFGSEPFLNKISKVYSDVSLVSKVIKTIDHKAKPFDLLQVFLVYFLHLQSAGL